jgi:hypothetical protein
MELDLAGTITAVGTAVAVIVRAVAGLMKVLRERRRCTCDCQDVPGCRHHAPELVG